MMELRRLGKYEIRGTLGKGAMGTVYDGYDAVIDRRVAIKTMNLPDPSDAEAQDELARFKREAQAAGRLTHPNIVAVYDYGEDGPIAFIVMEYAPGTELKKILDKGERLPPAEALRIMDGVLAGLQYSHERGVVHRDIKPGNIIISPDGTVKIADFGIARIESSSMTQAGTVMGTPAYMSPEQFMGQTVNARTDLYSAGVMLYQLLTGERPFEGGMSAIMHKALNTQAPRPSDLSVTAPPSLDPVVARAMAKRPEDRFESAAAFAAAIRNAMAEGASLVDPLGADDSTLLQAPAKPASRPLPTRPPTSPTPAAAAPSPPPAPAPAPRNRAPMFIGLAVVVLLLAGGGGYFALGGAKTADPLPPAKPLQAAETSAGGPASDGGAPAKPVPDAPVSPRPADPKPPDTKQADARPPDPKPADPKPADPKPADPKPVGTAGSTPQPPQPTVQPTVQPPVTPPVLATVPPPTQPPAQTPAQTPAQPPPAKLALNPPPTPLAIRDAVATALRAQACSLTRTSSDGRSVTVTGLVSRAAEATLRRAAREALPPGAAADSYTMRLDVFDGPYCDILDVIRPAATQPLALALRNNARTLRKDDDIVPTVAMPDAPSYLQVDYFSSDGGLAHLHPSAVSPNRAEAPRSTVVLGSTPKERWQVDAPFGTDMLVAIASAQPLFAADRPADETTPTYLDALRTAIETATRNGTAITANAIVLQTTAK